MCIHSYNLIFHHYSHFQIGSTCFQVYITYNTQRMTPEAVSSAVSEDGLNIPLIDFAAFVSGDKATRWTTAQAIVSGFQNAGFIYLRNHGIPKSDREITFAESAKFFKRSQVSSIAFSLSLSCFCRL